MSNSENKIIKDYKIDYNFYEALAYFKVDLSVFTNEMAKNTLDFFIWDYNQEGDIINEVIKKYAIEVIKMATYEDFNLKGIIDEFHNKEGYYRIDGSFGITLYHVERYEFDEDSIRMNIESE